MLIIQRYYLREFFKVLAIVAAGLAFIFSTIDLIDKIDDFLPHKPALKNLLLYVVFIFPRYLLYLLPMACLFCSLFVFSQANRREEITAIKAAGGRLKTLLRPFLIGGLFLSLFSFVLGEFITPVLSRKAMELKEAIMQKGKRFSFKEGTVWLRAPDGSIVKIGLYLPEKKISKNVSIFKIVNGSLKERIEADSAKWLENGASEGRWELENIILYNMHTGSISRFEKIEYPLIESPSLLAKDIQKPEDMGIGELLRYIRKLEEAGFKNMKLIVDLNAKVSYPFINFFMILLGISLPMRGRTGGGLVTTAIGIAISLLYWFSHAMSLSMGYWGILPPFAATWLVPFVFGFAAVKFFSRIQE